MFAQWKSHEIQAMFSFCKVGPSNHWNIQFPTPDLVPNALHTVDRNPWRVGWWYWGKHILCGGVCPCKGCTGVLSDGFLQWWGVLGIFCVWIRLNIYGKYGCLVYGWEAFRLCVYICYLVIWLRKLCTKKALKGIFLWLLICLWHVSDFSFLKGLPHSFYTGDTTSAFALGANSFSQLPHMLLILVTQLQTLHWVLTPYHNCPTLV